MTDRPSRVTYLTGTSYCGSTLLALVVDSHPQVASIGETSFRRKTQQRGRARQVCSCGQPIRTCPFWTRLFEGVQRQGYQFDVRHWTNDYRYLHPMAHRVLSTYSRRPAVRFLQRAAELLLPGHRAKIERANRVNVALVRTVLDLTGADVFFDTSKGALRLHYLLTVPELQVNVVRLVRDVRAFVESARRRGRALEDAVHEWASYHQGMERLAGRLPPERLLTVRYEDLCRDPGAWLNRLYWFMGVAEIGPPATVESAEHHVLGNRIRLNGNLRITLDEKWRDSLSRADQDRILAVAGTLNEQLGYTAQ
jgi:hypothetical protein